MYSPPSSAASTRDVHECDSQPRVTGALKQGAWHTRNDLSTRGRGHNRSPSASTGFGGTAGIIISRAFGRRLDNWCAEPLTRPGVRPRLTGTIDVVVICRLLPPR